MEMLPYFAQKRLSSLPKLPKAKIEVNLFYYDENRKKKIVKSLKKAGAIAGFRHKSKVISENWRI